MYDISKLNAFLQTILGPSKIQQKYEYLYFCPLCSHHKPKMAINLSIGKWHCWVCQNKGASLFSLLKKLNASKNQFKQLAEILNVSYGHQEIDVQDYILSLPSEAIPLWKPSKDIIRQHALAYLQSRDISPYDIIRYKMYYAKEGIYSNRIIIPSYDEENQLNYFVARAFFDSSLKYLNPPISKNIVGLGNTISWNYPIVLCEGIFDAIAIRNNAIPLFGKSIPSKIMGKIIEKQIKTVYLALDDDAISDSLDLSEMLMARDINVYLVNLGDKDPSKLGFEKMTEKLSNSKSLTFDSLIRSKITQKL